MRLEGGELRKPLGGPGAALGWTHFSTSMRWPGLLLHGTVDTLGQVVVGQADHPVCCRMFTSIPGFSMPVATLPLM